MLSQRLHDSSLCRCEECAWMILNDIQLNDKEEEIFLLGHLGFAQEGGILPSRRPFWLEFYFDEVPINQISMHNLLFHKRKTCTLWQSRKFFHSYIYLFIFYEFALIHGEIIPTFSALHEGNMKRSQIWSSLSFGLRDPTQPLSHDEFDEHG